jgi:hypothetical protein
MMTFSSEWVNHDKPLHSHRTFVIVFDFTTQHLISEAPELYEQLRTVFAGQTTEH